MNLIIIAIQLSIIYNIQSAAQNDAQACNSCCTAGIPGVPGNHGNAGAPGPIGPTGIQGNKGEQGPKGLPGNKGEQGPRGIQGNKGDIGTKGSNGIPGKLGPTGQKGEIGTTGEKGQKGEHATQKKSAFSVAFTSDPGRVTGILKYDKIITNVGNHYNLDTGKFVCVIPGTYVFQVTSTKSSGTGNVLTQIGKNGELVVSARMDADDGANAASTMTVLELVANDEVWTQPHSSGYNYYYSNGNRYCSFSGFLLYAS